MIVRIFKTNQIYVYAFIPLVILALRWPTLIGDPPFTSAGQLPFLSDFFSWLSNYSWLSLLLSIMAITTQGYWVNEICNEQRLFPFTSNFPAFMLAISYSVLTPQAWFSPVIFANVFLVLALYRISNIYHQGDIDNHLFRIGVYIALASLLYLPSIVMFGVLFYDLAIIRSRSWREYIMPMVGLITVYFWLFAWYFYREQSDIVLNYFIEPKTFLMVVDWSLVNWLPAIFILLLSIASIMYVVATSQKRTVRKNNVLKVIGVNLAITVALTTIYFRDLISVSILIWPALSILLTYYVLGIQKRWIQEGLMYVLVFVIVFRGVVNHLL